MNNSNDSKCPFNGLSHLPEKIVSIKDEALFQRLFLQLYSPINFWGLRTFGRFWLPRYVLGTYPGIISHFGSKLPFLSFIGKKFQQFTVDKGLSGSEFFIQSGIDDFAAKNRGVCTLWLNNKLCIYQRTNVSGLLLEDSALNPSTLENEKLFGSFMGTLPEGNVMRAKKRAMIETTLGSPSFIESRKSAMKEIINDFVRNHLESDISLDKFCRKLTAYVESKVPGVLDLKAKTLDDYIESANYSVVAENFFDVASEVIGKMNTTAIRSFDLISDMVKEIMLDNYESINLASDSNIFKAHFKIWDVEFTRHNISKLDDSQLKELSTTIVAIYDTTSLSLNWALVYLEDNPYQKEVFINSLGSAETSNKSISKADLVVLEAIRLGGSNPTALWRRTKEGVETKVRGENIYISKDTDIWLNRRQANRDSELFAKPNNFDLENISSIFKTKKETISSLLGRSRYEINSFSMINSKKNPRKCPARLFSVVFQSAVISELYKNYQIQVQGYNTSLKKFSSMPKPSMAGSINIRQKITANQEAINGK